jgi:hypothetical protein
MSFTEVRIDPYASHLPILTWAALLPERMFHCCLEIGTGFYSTALIQAIKGHSVENNKEWYEEVRKQFPKVKFIDDYKPKDWYSFIFIDSCPESSRLEFLKEYQYKSDLFILHDAVPEWEHAYHYEEAKKMFMYHKVVGQFPQTLVLSRKPIEGL